MSFGNAQVKVAAGTSLQPTGTGPAPASSLAQGGAPAAVASTGVGGTSLINGTQTLITWVAPNDGALHRVLVFGSVLVTTGETGGALQIVTSGGAAANAHPGGAAPGEIPIGLAAPTAFVLQPGESISLNQSTALTAGAAKVIAEFWGS